MTLDLQKFVSHISFPNLEWASVRLSRESGVSRVFRDSRPDENNHLFTSGATVEVLVNGQFAYASTPIISEKSLHQALQKAYAQALKASQFAIYKFSVLQRPKVTGNYSSPSLKKASNISPTIQSELLTQLCMALKASDKIVKTLSAVDVTEVESEFYSTNGSNVQQNFSYVIWECEAVAQEDNKVQKRTLNGSYANSAQGGAEIFDRPQQLIARARLVGQQALELLSAPECPTEALKLVLAPDQMMLQIHESIGHPLELDRILGDERNYAGWSFVKLSDFGSLKYGSPLLNVTFDPTVNGEFASYNFDDTGGAASREHLIQDGILVRGLGGLESQVRSGTPGVANMRASSWNRAPIDRMANLNIEPGDSTFESIIGGIERGIYMESNRSWSIDDYRNKFQFGCEYARLIENGKITKVVKNPNYRGVTDSFWHNLYAVGNAATRGIFGTPNCGKGEPNQAIRVGHASPVCAFNNVEVFGGSN